MGVGASKGKGRGGASSQLALQPYPSPSALCLPGSAEGGLTYGGKVILLLDGEVSSRL